MADLSLRWAHMSESTFPHVAFNQNLRISVGLGLRGQNMGK